MAAKQCGQSTGQSQWENDIQWEGRRQFIETHKGTLPVAKLEALSMVWANMKFLGCKYPSETESLVARLEKECPEAMDVHMTIQQKQEEGRKKAILKNFTLFVRDSEGPENPICLLHGNAQRAKKSIEFQELGISSNSLYSCAVVIDGMLIATGEAATKKEAKRNSAEKAVDILRKSQPVVDVLLSHKKASVIEKDDLYNGKQKELPRIPESNLGSQMLRKMGWTGGGVGKEGNKGREDPVMVYERDARQGLGHGANTNEVDIISVKSTIQRFMMDNSKRELRFSNTLAKQERAVVHQVSQKFGLRHKSYGEGDSRYLVISKQ